MKSRLRGTLERLSNDKDGNALFPASTNPNARRDEPMTNEREKAELGSGWRPIETAPKDGTRILAWGDERMVVTLYGKVSHVPIYGWLLLDVPIDPENVDRWEPTFWMPLPAPPLSEEIIRRQRDEWPDYQSCGFAP